ncbi:MAG TPA: hypothetical protein VNX88_08330 [Terriglobales bacterium]|jgi:hypothetical protein|nr:hypothetical protein [Terriglobales bacterium]
MSASGTAIAIRKPSALRAILWAGFACGVCDITAATVVYGYFGAKPIPLLQGIATGVMGPSARQGGLPTAALGLFLHFVIAFGAATTYFVASRFMSFLTKQAVTAGFLYGIAVYFFMQRVVIPLSAARRSPFSLKMMIVGIVIHMFCVGLPIALSIRKYSAVR